MNRMHPMQAMEMISNNLARLSGTRQDHAVLMQAEQVVREVVMKSAEVQAEKKSETDIDSKSSPALAAAENVGHA